MLIFLTFVLIFCLFVLNLRAVFFLAQKTSSFSRTTGRSHEPTEGHV